MPALSILALIVFPLALLATVILLQRDIRARASAAQPLCVRCGAPARLTEAFVCTVCRCDVRKRGLIVPGSQWPVVRVRRVMVCAPFFIATAALISMPLAGFHSIDHFRYASETTALAGAREVAANGYEKAKDGGKWEGRIVSDLYTFDGQVYSMEIAGDPPVASVVNVAGDRLAGPMPLDRQAAEAWVRATGADPSDPASQELVRSLYEHIGSKRPGVSEPSAGPQRSLRGMSGSWQGSGGSGGQWVPLEWVDGALVVVWSILWIPILRWVLHRSATIKTDWPKTAELEAKSTLDRQISAELATRARVADPTCGRCGYSTVGLNRMICPECGSDLRQVGIVAPGRSSMGGQTIGAMIAFSIAILLLAWLVSPLLTSHLPLRRTFVTTTTFPSPRSGAFKQAIVSIPISYVAARPESLPVLISLTLNSGVVQTLAVDLRAGNHGYTGPWPNVAGGAGFGFETVLNWMSGFGIDTSDSRVQNEAKEITTNAHKAVRSYLYSDSLSWVNDGFQVTGRVNSAAFGGGTSSTAFTSRRMAIRSGYVWWPLGLAGLWWIYRLGRRPRYDDSPEHQAARDNPDEQGEAADGQPD